MQEYASYIKWFTKNKNSLLFFDQIITSNTNITLFGWPKQGQESKTWPQKQIELVYFPQMEQLAMHQHINTYILICWHKSEQVCVLDKEH